MIPAGPAWLADIMAGAMIATAGYCASRIVYARLRRRRTERDLDAVHVAMGLAMAGMLVPRLDVLPGGAWGTGAWSVVFGAAAAWFVVRAVLAARTGARQQAAHHASHLVACAAMVYMLLAPTSAAAMTRPGGMGGMGASAVRFPTLALGLTVFLIGFAVVSADRVTLNATAGPGGSSGGCAYVPGGPVDAAAQSEAGPARVRDGVIAPRAATCCHIAMSVAMAYMLVALL